MPAGRGRHALREQLHPHGSAAVIRKPIVIAPPHCQVRPGRAVTSAATGQVLCATTRSPRPTPQRAIGFAQQEASRWRPAAARGVPRPITCTVPLSRSLSRVMASRRRHEASPPDQPGADPEVSPSRPSRRPRGSERGRRPDCSDLSELVVIRRLNLPFGASALPANGAASSGGPDSRWSSIPVVSFAGSGDSLHSPGGECRESRDDGSGAPLVPARDGNDVPYATRAPQVRDFSS